MIYDVRQIMDIKIDATCRDSAVNNPPPTRPRPLRGGGIMENFR